MEGREKKKQAISVGDLSFARFFLIKSNENVPAALDWDQQAPYRNRLQYFLEISSAPISLLCEGMGKQGISVGNLSFD